MFLRVIFFSKKSLVLIFFFYSSLNVGFVSSELSKRKGKKRKEVCRADNALRPCVHGVPQGLGIGPDSHYLGGGHERALSCEEENRAGLNWG